jgi:hypothetical protein
MQIKITKGRTKIVLIGSIIKIFWQDTEITHSIGVNCGINTLGLWTDSSHAQWQIVEKAGYLKVRVRFFSLL